MQLPGFFIVQTAVAGGAGGPNGAYLSLHRGDVVRVVGPSPTTGYVLGSFWGSLSWPRAATSNQGLTPESALRPASQLEVAPLSFVQPPGSNIPFRGHTDLVVGLRPSSVPLPLDTGGHCWHGASSYDPHRPSSVPLVATESVSFAPISQGHTNGGHLSATAFQAGMPSIPETTAIVPVAVEAGPPPAPAAGAGTTNSPLFALPAEEDTDVPGPPATPAAPTVPAAPLPPPTSDASSADVLIAEAVADARGQSS